MILDITALKDYSNIENLQKLSISLDMNKVILLLDGTPVTNNPGFLSKLVSMGIYNFAKNVEGIQYLYNTPNSYRDVAQFQQLSNTYQAPTQAPSSFQSAPAQSYSYQAPQRETSYYAPEVAENIVLGVKSVTKQAGATTLIYMMKKELSKHYSVVAIEADKTDFRYFRDKDLISATTAQMGSTINKYKNYDIILVDVNSSTVAEGFCTDMIYLIEPSIVKLNKLMLLNPNSLGAVKGKKVILNQSLLSSSEIANFEYESRLKVHYNLEPLNERRKNIPEVSKFLVSLGFNKQEREM